jgi:hypothetical protein
METLPIEWQTTMPIEFTAQSNQTSFADNHYPALKSTGYSFATHNTGVKWLRVAQST